MSVGLTPMMKQYLDIKDQHKDAILFFRLGDFYEMFFDDATLAAKILHITLTSRGNMNGAKVPMCGVPYHAAENYIARLIRQGQKVAICEQAEEVSPGKKIVDRQITKIITPGTFIADGILEASVNNYILSLTVDKDRFGIAYADLSTGEFRLTELDEKEDLLAELYKISPSECLVPESFSKSEDFKELSDINLGALTVNDDWTFDYDMSLKEIKRHFGIETLDGFGCEGLVVAIRSAGALLRYLKNTQKTQLSNIGVMSMYRTSEFMLMDRNSHRHLELVQNQEDLSTKGTLLEVLDETRTPMGKRMLKQWMLNPLLSPDKIEERLDSVQYFFDNTAVKDEIRDILSEIYDIERLSNKISLGSANARDMIALLSSLCQIDRLKKKFREGIPRTIEGVIAGLEDLSDIAGWISDSIVPDPPMTIKDGGIIKKGCNKDLDEIRDLISDGKNWVARLQKKEIERTGISSLKVGYNSIFGYYIEITKANLNAVPQDYVRKQTLVNAERFITQELKEYEARIIGAEERSKKVEYDLFCGLRDKISAEFERLKRTSASIANIDTLAGLAHVAVTNNYTRPRISDNSRIMITGGRHPVLEKLLKGKEFVPNDVEMDEGTNRIFIITGSNMAGKSTFIRQTALVVIMAQMGSFVPADKADIGVVDRVFTRVGASDRLYKGLSTFMVEMLETANILNNATTKSFIILDEIGRGTSTFDGVSIAWAVVEHLHHKIAGSKTMFATHYHELTELAEMFNGIKNYHLAVREWGDEIVFLYKVKLGSCDESFGIHVAKLAGMPPAVVQRAREILGNLLKESYRGNIRSRFLEKKSVPDEKQLDFFENAYIDHPVVTNIRELDLDNITPVEALRKLSEFKKEITG